MFKSSLTVKLARADVQVAMQDYVNGCFGDDNVQISKMEVHHTGSITLELEPVPEPVTLASGHSMEGD